MCHDGCPALGSAGTALLKDLLPGPGADSIDVQPLLPNLQLHILISATKAQTLLTLVSTHPL
jgi:hypothetical protein